MNKETIKKLKEFLALRPENFYMNIVITFADSHRVKTLSKLDNSKYKNFYFDEIVRITELMKYFEENYYFYRKGVIDDFYLNYNTVELYYLVEKNNGNDSNDNNRLEIVNFNPTSLSLIFMNKFGTFSTVAVAYKERIVKYVVNAYKNKNKNFYYKVLSTKFISTPDLNFFDPKINFISNTVNYEGNEKEKFNQFIIDDMNKNLSKEEVKEVIDLVKFDNI